MMIWFGQHPSGTQHSTINPLTRRLTKYLIFLLAVQLNNSNARIPRKAQVLNVEPHNINITLYFKYVSNEIAKTLYRKDKQNKLVHKFCSLINEQVGQVGAIMALKDGVTLFTGSDFEYPNTGCEIGEVRYPIPEWDVVDGNVGVEVLLLQRVFASEGVSDQEIVEYVKNGVENVDSFLPLLKDVIGGIEEVKVVDGFSSPVSAPSMPPSGISETPTLSPIEIDTISPSLKSSNFEIHWNITQYYNNPPRLNDDPEVIPQNNTESKPDVISTNQSATLITNSIETTTEPDSYTIPVAYIAAIAASTSVVVILVLFLLYFFTRKNSRRKKREEPPAELPVQQLKKSIAPPPAPLPKVPSYIDIEEMQSVDESTIGDHTAGRNPDKRIKPLPPIPSDSQHSQSTKTQRKPLSLNVDYDDDGMYPNRTNTPGTASPSLSSSSRVTPRANTRKSNQLVVSNQQLALTTPPKPVQPLISPVTFYTEKTQSPEHVYDDPDPEPVVMSSDSESEPEKLFPSSRFSKEKYQKKPQLQSFKTPEKNDQKSQGKNDEGSNDSKEGENPWLFEAVKETLGPRAVSADMESLGERSRHSHKSHRSSKHRRKKEGSSVGSRGSKTSHKSYRSQISKTPSEASRSVAMDLMRLENQLNSLSKTDSTMSVHSITSKSTTASKRRTMRNFIKLKAPPGKLGVILANRTDKPGTVVSDVRPSSPLYGKIFPGDRIVSIDGENVSMIPVSEITSIMARKADFERVMTVLTCKNGKV